LKKNQVVIKISNWFALFGSI